MRHSSSLLFIACAVLTACGFGFSSPVHAAIPAGSLIKASNDAVYYYASNGKRLVFPNEKTYKSWYADFSAVTKISDGDLAAIPLGGNVTYRPGVRLVKITTDPKVYAVSAHAVLRWVSTETVAQTLYGSNWNKMVDDVPDAYFTNYTVGAAIVNASDFVPSAQIASTPDIATDKFITAELPPVVPPPVITPPPVVTPPAGSSLLFTVSKTTAQAGDTVTLNGSVANDINISSFDLFFYCALIKTCHVSACSGDGVIPLSGTKSSYVAEARAAITGGATLVQTITIPIQASISDVVHIHVGQAVITQNQLGSVIADVDASIAVQRIDIYVDGNGIKACATGARMCQWGDYLTGTIGAIHPVYAKVTDTLGRTYLSKTLTITIGTTDSPSVTVTPAKNAIFTGETIDVTVTASDNDGISSIDVMKDGVVLKHCTSAAPCTATTGPWNDVTTLHFSGQAVDTKNTTGTDGDVTVSVTKRP